MSPDETAAINALIAFCRENKRICPLPIHWDRLWPSLPDRMQIDGRWLPPAPLILAAWSEASPVAKALRLEEHIVWASAHSGLEGVATFLHRLREEDWFHVGD